MALRRSRRGPGVRAATSRRPWRSPRSGWPRDGPGRPTPKGPPGPPRRPLMPTARESTEHGGNGDAATRREDAAATTAHDDGPSRPTVARVRPSPRAPGRAPRPRRRHPKAVEPDASEPATTEPDTASTDPGRPAPRAGPPRPGRLRRRRPTRRRPRPRGPPRHAPPTRRPSPPAPAPERDAADRRPADRPRDRHRDRHLRPARELPDGTAARRPRPAPARRARAGRRPVRRAGGVRGLVPVARPVRRPGVRALHHQPGGPDRVPARGPQPDHPVDARGEQRRARTCRRAVRARRRPGWRRS